MVSPIDRIGRTSVLLLVVLALTAGLARSAAPPRLSFGAPVAPIAPKGFDGFGDAESLVAGDLNGDGKADLAVGSFQDEAVWLVFGGSGSLAIQRNEYRVDGGPSALATGDLNGDGSVDLVVAKAHSSQVGIQLSA